MSVGSLRGSIVHACPWEGTQDQTVYDLLGICTRIDLGNLEKRTASDTSRFRDIAVSHGNCLPSNRGYVENRNWKEI